MSARQIQYQAQAQKVIDVTHARVSMQKRPVVLVTGGCGYIGSHTTLELLIAGWSVVVLDNLSNSNVEALNRVYYLMREYYLEMGSSIPSDQFPQLHFVKADIRHREQVQQVFQAYNGTGQIKLSIVQIGAERNSYRNASVAYRNVQTATGLKTAVAGAGKITHIIHFAALKSVGESAQKPLEYYATNVNGLLNVLSVLGEFGVKNIVFSSSAVIYGSGNGSYISEDAVSTGGRGHGGGLLTNPYGRTKWMDEEILNDWCISDPSVQAIALRYFNPTGCHPSGLIGEDPAGIPTNLMPIVLQTYQRRRSKVAVYGSDYDTKDGSGVRDFIHVVDLAKGHVAAINKLAKPVGAAKAEPMAEIVDNANNYYTYNLGTGTGYSVLEIIKAFALETGVEIPFQQGDRRQGDLGQVTANPTKAFQELGWTATHGLKEMCADLVKWADKNPTGYQRLRQLSTMAVDDQSSFLNRVRKASVVHRKQSMAPQFAWSADFEDIREEDEEHENLDAPDISQLIKSLVLNDDLFGMVATPAESSFTWTNDGSYFGSRPRSSGNSQSATSPRATSPRAMEAWASTSTQVKGHRPDVEFEQRQSGRKEKLSHTATPGL